MRPHEQLVCTLHTVLPAPFCLPGLSEWPVASHFLCDKPFHRSLQGPHRASWPPSPGVSLVVPAHGAPCGCAPGLPLPFLPPRHGHGASFWVSSRCIVCFFVRGVPVIHVVQTGLVWFGLVGVLPRISVTADGVEPSCFSCGSSPMFHWAVFSSLSSERLLCWAWRSVTPTPAGAPLLVDACRPGVAGASGQQRAALLLSWAAVALSYPGVCVVFGFIFRRVIRLEGCLLVGSQSLLSSSVPVLSSPVKAACLAEG